VAAGFPNDRPAQRAAEKVAKLLGGTANMKVVSAKKEEPLVLDDKYAGIVVIGRDQALIAPERLAALRTVWLAGTPLLLDNAAAAAAGVVFSAHEPTPEEGEEAELAAQRSFLRGRTILADGLALLPITVEPQLLKNNRWGRLFSLAYSWPELLTLGLTDDAAVEIGPAGGRVIGDNAVVVLDFGQATRDWGSNDAFVVANGVLDVFAPGDDLAPAAPGKQNP
jgi:cyanophycinase-like exopeptidase